MVGESSPYISFLSIKSWILWGCMFEGREKKLRIDTRGGSTAALVASTLGGSTAALVALTRRLSIS